MTFFVCFNLLLRFIISDSILLYVLGKKRERLDESEEEVEHYNDRKENWKKN